MTEFEALVKKYSSKKGITITEVAEEVGISRRDLYYIMDGTVKNEKVKAEVKKMFDSLPDKKEVSPEVLERIECANHLNSIILYSRMLSEREMRELANSVRNKALSHFEPLH